MPLYVYTCRTCELELEELHPLGQAPPRSIRCLLCGGYFERDVALFHVSGRKPAAVMMGPGHGTEHGVNCSCCTPRLARR